MMNFLSQNRALIALLVIGGIALTALALWNARGVSPTQTTVALGGLLSPNGYQTEFTSKPHLLLDVRTEAEYADAHIDGSLNIALQSLNGRLNEIPMDQPVVIYCRSGNRSAQAAQLLREAGYTEVYDMGGIIGWQQAGLPVVR